MTEPAPRLSRREAEHLLDDPAAHGSALGWALSTAKAPARPDELRREDAMVAAFHSARLTPPPAGRRAFVSPSRLGSRAAVHALVATGAVVAMASGAFALAGAVDLPGLPSLPGQASDRATEAVSQAQGDTASETTTGGSPSATSDSSTGRPGTGAPSAPGSDSPTGSSSATPTPTPNLAGLCNAFQATDRSDSGKALDSAAFTALATAADDAGADSIATYCVSLIGAPETSKPTGKPSPAGKPTDKPSPTGKPSTVPTPPGAPTGTPTGSPTDTPSPSKPSPGKPSPGKPTDPPGQSGNGGGKDSTTSGS